MGKYRLQIHGIIDTMAHARIVRDNFNLQLAGKDVHENHGVRGEVLPEGEVVFSADVRFNSEVDRDTVRDWIRARMRDDVVIRDWVLVRSRVYWHF